MHIRGPWNHHGDHIGYDQLPLLQDVCTHLGAEMIGGMELCVVPTLSLCICLRKPVIGISVGHGP